MPDYAVKTKFMAVDKMSAVFKAMGAKAKAFGDKTGASFDKASRKASIFRGAIAALGVGAAFSRLARGISSGLREVTKQWLDFDSAITQAAAKFPTQIRRGTLAFKQLGDAAREVGATTQFTAAEAAGGLNFLAMAGFNARQAISLLPGVTNLATIADMDLARATDIASDALGAFGLMTKNTSLLQERFTRVNDVMAKTITSTNTNMEQLFEAMKFAGPVATAAGAGLETFSAAAGELAQAGIKGSLAGTALRTMFVRLTGPPPKAQKALAKLGVSIKDSSGNMRDLFDVLGDLNKAFADKKLGKATRLQQLNAIFGRRAIAGVNVLLQSGSERLKDFRNQLLGAAGASKEMAVDIRQSLTNRLAELKSAAIEVGFKFIEAFSGKGGKSISDLTEAIRKFDVKPVVQGIKDVIRFVGEVKTGVEVLMPAIKLGAAAWAIYKGAVIAASIGQWALNTAMLANPIGLVTVAILAAAASLWIIAKNWTAVKANMERDALTIQIVFTKAILSIKQLFIEWFNTVISGINTIFGLLNKIPKAFGGGEILPQIAEIKPSAEDKKYLEMLNQARDVKARAAVIATIMNDKNLLQKANERIKAINFAKTRDKYQAVTPAPMSGDAIPEYELPTSGRPSEIVAPNAGTVGFEGRLEIAGAPEGSKYEQKREAPGLSVELLGLAS